MPVAGFPTGVHLLLERGGALLLLLRANTGFFDDLYSLPGGHVEPGESVMRAAVREAREELAIGLRVADLELVGAMHRRSDTNRIDFFVRAHGWQGEPAVAEPGKCAGLLWAQPAVLPDNTVPYVREALALASGEPWIREVGWPD